MTNLFEGIDVDEETPVQFAGVYVTRWKQEWGSPTILFREVQDPAYNATHDLLDALDQLVRFCEMQDLPDDLRTIAKARAAIAKAKGEDTHER
jgi:hypothetical protein